MAAPLCNTSQRGLLNPADRGGNRGSEAKGPAEGCSARRPSCTSSPSAHAPRLPRPTAPKVCEDRTLQRRPLFASRLPALRRFRQTQGRILFLTVCAAGIGGTFQFGYNLSIINAPTLHVQEFINETWLARTGRPLPDHLVLLVWSLIVSLYPLGGLFGALLAGPLAITLGRKKSLLVNNVFVVASAVLFGFSREAGSFEMILLGRLLVGVSAGVSMNVQPMYLGESAPQELRGAVAMTSAIFTALGIMLGQVVGIREFLGGPQAWPLLLASCLVPGVLQLSTLPLLPESPRYLLIDRGDAEACLAALRRLRGTQDVAAEMREMEEERAACRGRCARRPWELFQDRALRRQVMSLVVLGSAMELCGNDSCAAIERVGRRGLLVGGDCLMTFWGAIFTCLQTSVPWVPYLAMSCIFAFILSFGIGPAGVTGILATELFDQTARPAAYVVCGALMWAMLFLVGLGFPFIMEGLSHFLYVPFLGVCVCGAVYTGLFLPETKGKTFLEISEELHRLNFPRRAPGPAWRGPEVIQSTEL
ncbi:Solute carrier family 2, facilitated glucose transporter member 11 [Tupaia chinensis]|uniref:Solute carrier family 2, facilitated glucose transporter member 11 n=1 Tax=Tupaia chinensis TaxID=246437 RepID=L9LCH8_TUPCH|nr:Solute carrier family 2, facilitated glucose transporter member 11 [Tupaia chinensis]